MRTHATDLDHAEAESSLEVAERLQCACCVVGAGPAGAVLSLILARAGVSVALLEAHADLDRDFRGDTIHPSVMEVMDELGLAERVLRLRHTKIHTATLATPDGPLTLADFRRLRTRFPFITMLPQADFLEFITAEARRYANFQMRMGARVEELIEEGGAVRGVRYEDEAGTHEVRAMLTVGADGRGSRVRHLAGFEPIKTSPPMDVLWFRLPRRPEDPEGAVGRFGRGHIVIMLDRLDEWQVGYVILKGSYRQVRAAGLDALKRSLADLAPEFADRLGHLRDWKQVSMLSVESSRVRTWYKPGLLLIGDAAHVMSPVGGVGINYAIMDAVAAANLLAEPLRRGQVTTDQLGAVQRRRELPTRIIQAFQTFAQRRVIAGALRSTATIRVPTLLRLLLRLSILRDLPARLIGFGFRPEHVRPELRK